MLRPVRWGFVRDGPPTSHEWLVYELHLGQRHEIIPLGENDLNRRQTRTKRLSYCRGQCDNRVSRLGDWASRTAHVWVMKTARFTAVVRAAGKPTTHLLLVPPEKDKLLQAAIKACRVMTVHQRQTGTQADHGTVGFEPGGARQYLIFPKSLSKFQETQIIGIKYDLLDEGISKKGAEPAKPQKSAHPRRESVMEDTQRPASEKVVHFTRAEPRDEPDKESEAIKEIKNQVRHAMEVLEQGKQVAAFNLLKRILDL
jgi:hypothetical protein